MPLSKDYRLLENIGFATGYSETRRNPIWTSYHLVAGVTQDPGKRPSRFHVDERTSACVSHDDYKQADYSKNPNAYDRGHMAPNHAIATFFGRDAQFETFAMSNVCPQAKRLNQQCWEALEKTIAGEWVTKFHQVWVTVGPIFGSTPSRLNGVVEIPEAFYAIVSVADDRGPHVLALVMPQESRGQLNLRSFVTTVDAVELATALDFHVDLQDELEDRLESSKPDERWDLGRIREPSSH